MPRKSLAAAFWAFLATVGSIVTADTSTSGTVKLNVHRVERSVSPGAVTDIGGFVGERLKANREGYLHRFDIERYVRMTEEKQYREWRWVGRAGS